MSGISQPSPGYLSRFALAVSPNILTLLVPAIACIAFASLYSDRFLGLLALCTGLTLVLVVALARVLAGMQTSGDQIAWSQMSALMANDAAPCFGTGFENQITFQNSAASARFTAEDNDLLAAIARTLAISRGNLMQIRDAANRNGACLREVELPGGRARIQATKVENAGVCWRIEEIANAVYGAGRTEFSLPVLELNGVNSIVDMNPAMEDLLGGRPTKFDRVVTKLGASVGEPSIIETSHGQRDVYMCDVKLANGHRQYFIWPHEIPEQSGRGTDAFPIPTLQISVEGRIKTANSRAKAMLAIDDEEVDFAETVEGLGRPINEWILEVAEGRSTGRAEIVRATRPEQDVFLQVALSRMVENGEVSVVAVLIDATEIKTLEAQFVQSQKMQAIGQLAGGVAHDFNNLLTAISGHCDLLMLRHEPGDPNYGDLVQISQNANRAASLVGQLLAFSRKQNMQPEVIDLRETLGDLTHLLNRLVGERVDLRWSHAPDLPNIRADKRQLEQVLMNLVVNARDAMPSGGKVEVTTGSVRLHEPLKRDRAEVPLGDYVVVKVADEGCGIATDKLPKIFEPFYSTKRLGEGTGLGLSMAYGIVKQSGGYIFADSDLSQGTVFSMYFPAYHVVDTAIRDVTSESPIKSITADGGVVLLVEDEAPVRAFASRALRLRGYKVIEAECAETALQKLEDLDLQVDVFVTDVVMPGLDGPSWVNKAMKERPDVKVVFVSGYAEDSLRHNRSKVPNSVFLPKPFSLSELTETVQRQLQ